MDFEVAARSLTKSGRNSAHTIPYQGDIIPQGQLNQNVVNFLNKFVPAGERANGNLDVIQATHNPDDYQYTCAQTTILATNSVSADMSSKIATVSQH